MKEPRLKNEDVKQNQVIRNFLGMNTKSTRTALKDEEFAWLENLMPIGHGNLRVIPQPVRQDSVSFSSNPIHGTQTNISGTIYNVVFLSNGSAYAINQSTFASTTIGAPGTFTGTSISTGQWQNQYLLIADPVKGYYTWDGASLVLTTFSSGGENLVGIASFSARVWVAAGRTVYYTAVGSPTDFTGASSGNIILSDETLFGNITALLSANNFLYVFGESSINVFSDVRVNASGVTLFTNTNVSASIGTKFADSIVAYYRSVVFMNEYGVYALVGSTTSKISDDMDGVFNGIDFTQPITAGQSIIFNTLCLSYNVTYTAPSTGITRKIQMVFFEKKWFVSVQTLNANYPTILFGGNSDLGPSAYGIFPQGGVWYMATLYATNSNSIMWEYQTALWGMGRDIYDKQVLKWGCDVVSATSSTLTVVVESEGQESPPVIKNNSRALIWENSLGSVVTWQSTSGVVEWTNGGSAFNFYRSDANMYGKYVGMTGYDASTPDAIITSIMMQYEVRDSWG